MELPQAYHVLGVRPGATSSEVRDAHDRLLAASPPPDRTAQVRDAAASIHAAGYPTFAAPGLAPTGPGAPLNIAGPGVPGGPPAPAPGNPWQVAPPPAPPASGWQGAPPPAQQGYPFAPETSSKKKGAGAAIGIGAVALIIGIAITAGTHSAAEANGGGTYVIAYGPIVFGAISIFRGLIMLGSSK